MKGPVVEILLRALLRWSAAMAFCLPLKHRPHFWLRGVAMYLPLVVLAWLLDPLGHAVSLIRVQLSLLVMYGAFFLLLGLMIWLCAEVDWKSALYCAVWSLLIGQAAYEGWRIVEQLFELHGRSLQVASLPVRLAQLAAGGIFYGAVCVTLARRMPYKKEYHIGPRQLGSAFLLGSLFMIQSAFLTYIHVEDYPLSVIFTILLGQIYLLTLLYFQTELFKKSALQKEMDALNLLYERQRQQYQVARQNVQMINKRCHELKVQIASLRRLAPDAQLEQHINEAERAVHLYDASCNTGNEVLDVVLTEKSMLCESRRIRFSTVVDGSCLNFFEAGDLYALFANALDHAVESAVQTTRQQLRAIDLLVCVRQGFAVVNLISPTRPPEKEETRTAQYELKVVKRIVNKYKGTLTTEQKDGFFAVKIIFPCKVEQ